MSMGRDATASTMRREKNIKFPCLLAVVENVLEIYYHLKPFKMPTNGLESPLRSCTINHKQYCEGWQILHETNECQHQSFQSSTTIIEVNVL